MDRIHSSHSRKELCHIIEVFDLPIANYREMNKKEISKSIMYESVSYTHLTLPTKRIV